MIPLSVRARGDKSSKSPPKHDKPAKNVHTAKSSIAWKGDSRLHASIERRMSSSVLDERGIHNSFGPKTSTLLRSRGRPEQLGSSAHHDSQMTQQAHDRELKQAREYKSHADLK